MSLEEALAANTAALKELTAALLAAGALQTAQASSAAASSPAVQAVVKAQKAAEKADAKKQDTATAASAQSAPSGEQFASTPTKSSDASPSELHPWHEKTAKLFGELDGGEATLENLRKAILGINQQIGRAQAEAILHRFGAEAITEKKEGDTVIKKGLDAKLYPKAFALCLDVLAGRDDATLAKTE
jgi:hypothetical protein